MARLIVDTPGGTYPVHIGRGALKELRRTMARLEPTGAAIIADAGVRPIAQAVAKHVTAARVKNAIYVVPGGERSKSLAALGGVLAFLERQRIDRAGCVVAVGGGTVGDLAGMAAATWLRGIRYVEVPTTLLAMVDSSIGGKTGINGVRMKNAIGSFWQPSAVISDLVCLDTLPRSRYREAFAEVVKYAVAMDRSLFDVLRRESARLTAGDPDALEDVIYRCATAKALVVARDERDRGPRAILNYGHTAAHALEAASRYRISHGRAVAFGMRIAANIASDLGLCSDRLVDAQDDLLITYGLRDEHPRVSLQRMMAAIPTDKKARRGRVAWVLPRRVGHAVIGQDVPMRLVRRVLRSAIA
ncbi:MAG TPA: 3-dehydroquinate synthase [Candidatus Dormibacteraeota bacterium]|nr:3-dehydroquinate synthase [Candidatus Dormibacteraeota bacterium]